MAEVQLVKIRGIYGEIKGILAELEPVSKSYTYNAAIISQYNSALDELAKLTDTSYSRSKITDEDKYYNSDDIVYEAQNVRTKIGSLLSRLENEYGFDSFSSTNNTPILNITNTNQMQLTVVNIDQLVNEASDEATKNLLMEIKLAVANKDKEKSKTALTTLLDKSWELFLKVLPWVLEHWSKKI